MASQHRLERLVGQLSPATSVSTIDSITATPAHAHGSTHEDPVVVVSALRTPITRARKGGLAAAYWEDMLTPVLKATIERTKIDPKLIGDVVVGTVLGVKANEARISCLLAGLPDTVPVHVLNRQCSSGLQAIATVAANILAGNYEIGIGAGCETMTRSAFGGGGGKVEPPNARIFLNQAAKDCLLPMGITSENVATDYGVDRKTQDTLAVASHAKAAAAQKAGRFDAEIVPVVVRSKDQKTGADKETVVKADDGIRADTTLEGLSKLKPAFKPDGSTTAGNASQVSDGAAASLLMRRSMAQKLGLPIIGIFRSFAVAGVPPRVMGIGPAVAIPAALAKAGLKVSDIDLWEINEAFASQAAYCVKVLGVPLDKLNVNGGAIALGHPLGATGARQTATLLHELGRRRQRFGVVSMCIGSGMGAAAVYERV